MTITIILCNADGKDDNYENGGSIWSLPGGGSFSLITYINAKNLKLQNRNHLPFPSFSNAQHACSYIPGDVASRTRLSHWHY
jgi:hypothetical protein